MIGPASLSLRASVVPICAVGVGLGLGFATTGSAVAIAIVALVLAGVNGYSKAYSP